MYPCHLPVSGIPLKGKMFKGSVIKRAGYDSTFLSQQLRVCGVMMLGCFVLQTENNIIVNLDKAVPEHGNIYLVCVKCMKMESFLNNLFTKSTKGKYVNNSLLRGDRDRLWNCKITMKNTKQYRKTWHNRYCYWSWNLLLISSIII